MVVWLLASPVKHGQDTPSRLSWITSGIHGLLGGNKRDGDSTPDVDELGNCKPACAGDVIISKMATLEELKQQLLTLPVLSQLPVPTTDFLRVRLMENKLPTLVLRGSTQILQYVCRT